METFMTWLSFVVLVWLAGAGMRYWPGPIRVGRGVMTSAVSRHRSRRPEAHDTHTEGDTPDVMTPGGGADGDVENYDPSGILTRSIPQARTVYLDTRYGPDGTNPCPIGGDDGEDDNVPSDRRTWVAQQISHGHRPSDIDDKGARLYGVTPRTIARDRMALTRQRGTKR